MSDASLSATESGGELIATLRRPPRKDKRALRNSFWRMVAMVYPHRRTMTLGVLLGLGVALTYAASLGGLLPVLKVVVEEQNVNSYLLERAERAPALFAPLLTGLAQVFPTEDSPAARMTTLLILLGALLAVNVVGNGLRCLSQYLVLYASNRMVMDLRRRMYRKALHVPMTRLTSDHANAVSAFMSDVREVFLGIVTLFGKVAREPLKAVCVLAVACFIDLRLTLIAGGIALPAVLILWIVGRGVRKATVRMLQGYAAMLRSLEESLQGIDTVKGYAREGHERVRMWRLERGMMRHQLRLAWIESFSSPLLETLGVLAASAGIVWLASRTFAGEITPSHFITMVILLGAILDPIRKVANVYNVVQRSGAAADRIFGFLDEHEQRSVAGATELRGDRAPEVRFEHVSFRYSPDATPALRDVSLTVRAGECVAIVGPNGSGKSTLLKLLPRLLEPQDGGVCIDGADVRDVQLRSLRERVAIVSQRPVIFARSARENIAYGNPAASAEEIRTAAQRAYAAEFIEAWPQGYDAPLGEFGASISGGQRQRIAIARAFLKPSTILIFDEATSEIDAESEGRIHAALNELRRGKTTFLIAHRHTVMEMADRLVVMDAGRIVDTGTHDELIDRCPLYVALYRSPEA
ncbi:MAG: ABC transporter ATP-binding protein [Planctomycetia bacterium]|nr:MAG: ABC transporter ATP-binding protein [Planctomycetia bacterium]